MYKDWPPFTRKPPGFLIRKVGALTPIWRLKRPGRLCNSSTVPLSKALHWIIPKKELRRYTEEQSVQMAEQLIRREMRPEDDARLISHNLEDLGGGQR